MDLTGASAGGLEDELDWPDLQLSEQGRVGGLGPQQYRHLTKQLGSTVLAEVITSGATCSHRKGDQDQPPHPPETPPPVL